MTASDGRKQTTSVRFESAYGCFQPPYWWLFGFVGLIGLVGVPLGMFWNKGWKAGNHPLEPWAATLIIEIISVGALLTVVAIGVASTLRRRRPQRVALTNTTLILPKGMFSGAELELPLSAIDTTVFNAGFVKQLQIKHGRRKILLSSALFPTNVEFDRLVSCLSR